MNVDIESPNEAEHVAKVFIENEVSSQNLPSFL